MYRTLTKNTIRSAILICLCFLVTSTGWLAWEYHLFDQIAVRHALALGPLGNRPIGHGPMAFIVKSDDRWNG